MLSVSDVFLAWVSTLPGYVFLLVGMISMTLIWWIHRGNTNLKAAIELVESGQFEQVSEEEIDDLIFYADSKGKKNMVLNKLSEIRQQYGHGGIKKGHMFIMINLLVDPDYSGTQWADEFPSFTNEEKV